MRELEPGYRKFYTRSTSLPSSEMGTVENQALQIFPYQEGTRAIDPQPVIESTNAKLQWLLNVD